MFLFCDKTKSSKNNKTLKCVLKWPTFTAHPRSQISLLNKLPSKRNRFRQGSPLCSKRQTDNLYNNLNAWKLNNLQYSPIFAGFAAAPHTR